MQPINISNTASNGGEQSFPIEVYSLNEGDDRPMIRNRRGASLEEVESLSKSDHSLSKSDTTHRTRSSRRTFRDRLASMNALRPVARSFDALDPESSIRKHDVLQCQEVKDEGMRPILKRSSSDSGLYDSAEIIKPAPDSPTDDSDNSCSFKENEDNRDDADVTLMTDLEGGTLRKGGGFNINSSARNKPRGRVSFEEPTTNIDGSQRSTRSSRLLGAMGASSSMQMQSMRGLTRQISAFILPSNEDRRKSMTAQRYSRRQSVMNIMTSDVTETLKEMDDLSDDTVHRLKSLGCCMGFSVVLAALLYYMLKE